MTKFESHTQNSDKSLCGCRVFLRPLTNCGGGGGGQSINGGDLWGDIDLTGGTKCQCRGHMRGDIDLMGGT